MQFDVYYPFKNKEGKLKPGVTAHSKSLEEILAIAASDEVTRKIDAYRAGDPDAKAGLPSVCWVGHTTTGKRGAMFMEPTQIVMVDIDHVKHVDDAIASLTNDTLKSTEVCCYIGITPSGSGLRLLFRAVNEDYNNLPDYLDYLDSLFHFDDYGDFDKKAKDLSRISFIGKKDEIRYINHDVLSGAVTYEANPIKGEPTTETVTLERDNSLPSFSDEEVKNYEARTYRGTDYQIIIKKYLEVFGEPGQGEIHNYYNEMVKNFRCICDNNKRFLLWLLPRFGHTEEECWSQIVSICKVNTLSKLPKSFYFFLKDNGYYNSPFEKAGSLASYMMKDEPEAAPIDLPYLPPVFRELVGTAPADFIVPCVNALLPILGTLTSYLRAVYPYDSREHSTSFFSVIYAPAGTGKGFVERFIDLLFEDLKLRDFVQSERENVYLRAISTKGANEKAPDAPHVSLRIIPPKNSEAEFLQKQRDNHGYHMFTFAAEMDSWAKGVKAAGGNKDDMIRIAWDNGEYGQQFKAANTFKGQVRLYWNVLITGTIAQVENYFKNVENGLVSRCSFTPIENQEFAMPPQWRKLTKRALENIKKFTERCDRRTYETPCNFDVFEVMSCPDDKFDESIDWHFKFRPTQTVDMSWIMPTIDAFNKEQVVKGARDVDRARDVFRRRVAVRGFRLGLLCYGLWENPKEKDLMKCCEFVDWWMHQDLESTLKLWGEKYNSLTDVPVFTTQRTVFDELGDDFSRTDVYEICIKQGIKTPVRRIIHDWLKKVNCIKQIDKNHFKKIKS